MLQFTGSERVGHDLAPEQQQQQLQGMNQYWYIIINQSPHFVQMSLFSCSVVSDFLPPYVSLVFT